MTDLSTTTGRRTVLRAGAIALTAASYRRILGAGEVLNAALIGCGSRGTGALLPGSSFQTDLRFVAACDVYKRNLDNGLAIMAKQGNQATGYADYRQALDRKDIDVVFVATPDHWHAPLIAAACQAGKDVYCEKPLANTLEDCKMAVDAAAKYNRVVQIGLQQRSMDLFKNGAALLKDNAIGRVRRGVVNWSGESGGGGGRRGGAPQQNVPVPEGLDWEMWQGSAPRHPFDPQRLNSWRTFWDYGSGSITDLGVHMIDVFQWFVNSDAPAITYGAAYSLPGRPPERTPEFFDLTWKYEQQLLTYSSRAEGDWGLYVYGDTGMLHVNRQVCEVKPSGQNGKPFELKMPYTAKESEAPHIRNFLDCVRSRQKPNCDIVTGYRSTAAGLIAAMSVRSGKSYAWDGAAPKAM
jgi:predicted dehydrogenase